MERKIYRRFFVDTGRIIGTVGLGLWGHYYHGYKFEGGVKFLLWYVEVNIYRNKQQIADFI